MEMRLPLSSYIDHTTLKPSCTKEDIQQLCEQALQHQFAAVCVPPYFVQMTKRLLQDSPVKVSTVIGFPMGYSATAAKVEEIKRAINDGADELDVVINIAAVKNQDWTYVENDIAAMSMMTSMKGKVIKVIVEVALLNDDELKKLCDICSEKEVNYVKTATGINGKGNQLDKIRLLRKYLPDTIKIKAAGGIQTQAEALSILELGVDRLGCSRSIDIIKA